MERFTKLNAYLFRPEYARLSVFAQRVIMKLHRLRKSEWSFVTSFGTKMRGNIFDSVTSNIFFFGVWEPNLTKFMIDSIRPGQCVVDVGANVGYYSLLMSKLVGNEGRVISVDASPSIFKRLKVNIDLNGASNILAHNIALSDHGGEIKLFNSPIGEANTGMATLLENRGGPDYSLVKCDTLMNVLGELAEKVSFIKIDIEGAELPILEDILKNKDRFAKPLIVVSEVDDLNMSIVDKFRAQNFSCFYIENDYTIEGYLRTIQVDEAKRLAPKVLPTKSERPPSADLVFIYG